MLVILALSHQSDNDWRAAQLASQKRFDHQLQVVDAEAAAANARDLAQQAAGDRQALAYAPVGAGTADSVAGGAAPRSSPGTAQPARFPGPLGWGHYVKVSVAVAGDTLCVDFTALAPPKPSTFYIFQFGRPQQQLGFFEGKWRKFTNEDPSLGIDVVFGPNGERAATLRYPGVDETPNLGIAPA